MNLLIAGCGTVGAELAEKMCGKGHSVSVIDNHSESFEKLGGDFSGYTVTGNAIDLDQLRKAGIESCDAVAAMTSSDNVNAMLSQIAKEVFKIEKVFTRIYDTERAQIFAQFGLHTVCPTALTVDFAANALTSRDTIRHVSLGGQTFKLCCRALPATAQGKEISQLEHNQGEVAVGLLHPNSTATLAGEGSCTVSAGDKLLFIALG